MLLLSQHYHVSSHTLFLLRVAHFHSTFQIVSAHLRSHGNKARAAQRTHMKRTLPGEALQDAVSQEINMSYCQGTRNSMPRPPLVYFEEVHPPQKKKLDATRDLIQKMRRCNVATSAQLKQQGTVAKICK